MADYIGALDQGTTSTRFIVFDRENRVVALAQKEHRQIYPQPGWVEHDPEEIWQRTQEVISEAMNRGGLKPKELAAIGITNQRETAVLWDCKTGKPAANAIVWQDMRTEYLVRVFSGPQGHDRYQAKTGLPLSTYFSALKIHWLLHNVPGLLGKARAGEIVFGNVDTFLVWKLTGGASGGIHVTDVSNASRTQLMNLQSLAWDKDVLADFEIPEAMLPQIRSSSEIYGASKIEAIKDVPIAGILGDQQAALMGQTCFKRGETKNTYGTGCFLLMNTGAKPIPSKHGLLTTVAYKLRAQPACYALEGSIAITGALVQWLRDNLKLIENSADVEALACTVADNGGVYFVPAFSGLYAPYWKPDARGVIAGLTRFANRGHIARAALEATAFQVREVVEAMENDSGISLDVLRTDGGMIQNNLLMQFQADILNRPVVCSTVQETTALGAAYAAGLAVGFYPGTDEVCAHWKAARTWRPSMDGATRDKHVRMWTKAVTRAFDWSD